MPAWFFVVLAALIVGLVLIIRYARRLRRLERLAPRCELLWEHAPLGILLLSPPPELRILDANPTLLRFLRQPAAAVLGRRLHDFLPELGGSETEALLEEAARSGKPVVQREWPYPFPDRGLTYWSGGVAPLPRSAGPAGLLLFTQEVTEQVRLRERLRAALERELQAERKRREFYREMVAAVSRGRVELVEEAALELPGEVAERLALRVPEDVAALRRSVTALARRQGLPEERGFDLGVAASEAATNALRHAGAGEARLFASPGGAAVRIEDEGPGIAAARLPHALFRPGYSTQATLGMGFTLMMELADRLCIATRPGRTVVQLEQQREPPPGPSLLDGLVDSPGAAPEGTHPPGDNQIGVAGESSRSGLSEQRGA